MIEILATILGISAAVIITIFVAWSITSFSDWNDSPSMDQLEKWNMLNLVYIPIKIISKIDLKPKNKIERDIAKELKAIKKEESEIESMQELERLIKIRKEIEIKKENLFVEVKRTKEHSDPTREEELFYFSNDGLSRSISIPVPKRANASSPVKPQNGADDEWH